MNSKNHSLTLLKALFLMVAFCSQLNAIVAIDDFHRGPHPGDQDSGNADPKLHGEVKRQGYSVHHFTNFNKSDLNFENNIELHKETPFFNNDKESSIKNSDYYKESQHVIPSH